MVAPWDTRHGGGGQPVLPVFLSRQLSAAMGVGRGTSQTSVPLSLETTKCRWGYFGVYVPVEVVENPNTAGAVASKQDTLRIAKPAGVHELFDDGYEIGVAIKNIAERGL